jgi:hypothetical protein
VLDGGHPVWEYLEKRSQNFSAPTLSASTVPPGRFSSERRFPMRVKTLLCASVAILALCALHADAKPAKAPAVVPLSAQGEEFAATYAKKLDAVKGDIISSLPTIDEQKRARYFQAQNDEKTAETNLLAAQKAFGAVKAAEALVAHAKGKWLGGADKGIAQAKGKLAAATTPAEKDAAEKELAKWQKNREEGLQALEEREAALVQARADEPKLQADLAAAEMAFAEAQKETLDAVAALGIERLLASGDLDAKLATFVVLHEATPRGLAAFAQQSDVNAKLVDRLLNDWGLMKQMVMHDGAVDGKYGQAMKIYTDIVEADRRATQGVLHELALAVALEHAVPKNQANPANATDASAIVDPVARYREFATAYEKGELDPAFKSFTAWELRFVVDGDEPEGGLAWGREMLRNYRPDHITNPNYAWRYVEAVRTDVMYGSQDQKFDRPDLFSYQNMIMNGGVCGRRAFFGRYILRSFGIPTTARPQKGHAALVHWTPKGWVVNLGAGWGAGHTKTRYGDDLNFLATTQARTNMTAFMEVKRAQWIGDVMGEKPVYGLIAKDVPGFWYGVSLYRQQQIIKDAKAVVLAAVGENLGEANETGEKEVVKAATITDGDRKITVAADGTITIPAAATSNPKNSTGKIRFMPSPLGGMQLHYNRTGGPEDFEYAFDAPEAGDYTLTARVVTTSPNQHLLVAANGASTPVDIAVPHTVGMWETTPPVTVSLAKGKNVLKFSHSATGAAKGVTIKDLALVPAK